MFQNNLCSNQNTIPRIANLNLSITMKSQKAEDSLRRISTHLLSTLEKLIQTIMSIQTIKFICNLNSLIIIITVMIMINNLTHNVIIAMMKHTIIIRIKNNKLINMTKKIKIMMQTMLIISLSTLMNQMINIQVIILLIIRMRL